eukprot:scaffold115545_cov44-Prasinocladus_malaysianus.AAC.1
MKTPSTSATFLAGSVIAVLCAMTLAGRELRDDEMTECASTHPSVGFSGPINTRLHEVSLAGRR